MLLTLLPALLRQGAGREFPGATGPRHTARKKTSDHSARAPSATDVKLAGARQSDLSHKSSLIRSGKGGRLAAGPFIKKLRRASLSGNPMGSRWRSLQLNCAENPAAKGRESRLEQQRALPPDTMANRRRSGEGAGAGKK
jgi:hypothetical protein